MSANFLNENELGVQDSLSHGLANVKNKLAASHPLENQEQNYSKLEEEAFLMQARISQGLYAPFKLKMERDLIKQSGRLSCLKSANLSLQVLKGTDETIEIEDVLNNQKEFGEFNSDPHSIFASRRS